MYSLKNQETEITRERDNNRLKNSRLAEKRVKQQQTETTA